MDQESPNYPFPIDHWLTPREVHEIYRIHPVTLCEWRRKRIGPAFRQIGRSIHYRRSAVEAYIDAHTIQTTG